VIVEAWILVQERGMGCMWSAEEFKEGDDTVPSASAQTKLLLVDNADAHVFIPGFRTPKPTDLAVALQRFNIPSALLNRLVSLRSGVIQAVGGEEEAVSWKSKKRKSHQGLVDFPVCVMIIFHKIVGERRGTFPLLIFIR
jgi:hypothetical protein